ncbi:predicted protein, partial [Nematostella vectensis]
GIFLLILVTSAPGNFEARSTIRRSWGKRGKNDAKFHVVFMLGATKEPEILSKLKEEIGSYGDLIIGKFTDSYSNLPLKSLMSLRWASQIESQFTVKTDDDMYIHTTRLYEWLLRHQTSRLYAGKVRQNAKVNRFRFHRYSVSYKNYQEQFYPAYCYGGFYVLSREALTSVLSVSKRYHPFPAEDAYLGVLAKEVGITP